MKSSSRNSQKQVVINCKSGKNSWINHLKVLFYLNLAVSFCLGISSVRAQLQPTSQLKPDSLTQAESGTEPVTVTNIRLNQTAKGIELVLETTSDKQVKISTSSEGNTLTADIENASLSPEVKDFRAERPQADISSISAVQIGENKLQIRVTGISNLPKLETKQSGNNLVLSLDAKEQEIQITVTATRTSRAVESVPATVTVIESEDLDRNLVQNLDDLVRYEPGISASRSPNRYGFQEFNIRGIEGNRILTQVDGVRLPESFEFGSTQLGRDYIDPEIFKRVEIIRGSASTLYGSDAIGGVVTFLSKDPADFLSATGDDFAVNFKVAYDGANRGLAETATLAGRYGQLEGLFIYTRRDYLENQINSDRQPNPQSGRSNNFLAKLVYNLDESNQIKLTGEFLDRKVDTDVLSSQGLVFTGSPVPIARIDSLRANDTIRRDRYALNYEYNNPDSSLFFQYLNAQIYYQSAESTETSTEFRRVTPPLETGAANRRRFRDSIYQEDVFGAEVQIESNFKTGDVAHRLVYGTEISNTKVSRLRDGFQENLTTGVQSPTVGPDTFPVKDFADTDNSRFGIYLQDEITLGKLTIIPGIRYDSYNLTPKPDDIFRASSRNFPTGEFSDSAISPKLGLVLELSPEVTAFAQYARGFRSPTAVDINPGFTNPGLYQVIANPDLKAETSNNFELGLRGNFSKLNFSISGFYNTYNNFIDTFGRVIPTPGLAVGTFQTVNRGEVRIYGLEAKGELDLGSGFSLLASTSYAVGDDLESDRPLASVDPFKLVGGLRYRHPQNVWGTELFATYAGRPRLPETEDLPNPFVPDSYFTVDLVSYYNINPNLSFNLGLFNIFNQKYWQRGDVRGLSASSSNLDLFLQPGFTVSAGLKLVF
jgi:hemoglobin/transferrin/lactoferrin receptor protein